VDSKKKKGKEILKVAGPFSNKTEIAVATNMLRTNQNLDLEKTILEKYCKRSVHSIYFLKHTGVK
jgi:hypothetical protein